MKKFVFKMLKVLRYLHKRKIIHRDLKPGNILISNNNLLKFKIADFGLSSYLNESCNLNYGTIGFFAPEIL
jgi:serine/threonine protein kinase